MGSEEARLGPGQGPIAREMSWLVKICSSAMWCVSERNSFSTLPVQSPHTHRQMHISTFVHVLYCSKVWDQEDFLKENSGSTLQ